jgi:hypothetical protein
MKGSAAMPPHQAMYDNLELFSVIGLAGVLEFVAGFYS